MIDATQPIANAVRKHFVSLSCVQSKPNSTGRKLHLFSGFVIEILDAWFFITAGHVVRDLRTETAAGSTFGKWRLADTISGPKFQNTAVPFEFSLDSWLVVENESIGIDYAAIHLEDFFARQLSVGGVTPIARDAWADQTIDSDLWALAGTPADSVEHQDTNDVVARFVLTPLVRTEVPSEAGPKSFNQFYARLREDSSDLIKNVEGMSGGPVISIKFDGVHLRYWIIGVQSAWYPTTRTVCVCPFSSFALEVEDALQDIGTNTYDAADSAGEA